MNATNATVVLVHAAWADESSWDKVVRTLQSKGIKTVTPRLPLSSLPDDTAALDQALAKIEGPVVLVGHAYAGAVISATQSAKVKALVYIAGLAQEEGETEAEVFNRFGHAEVTPQLAPDENGWIRLPQEAFASAFAQHASPSEQQAMAVAQLPISINCIIVPAGEQLWKRVPSWYLLAEDDLMIPAQTQRFIAERMHARIGAYPVDHVPMVSAPQHVEQMILDALQHVAA
jgi:pimeloyl-ACP methyl ester carboxylesterase